MTTPAHSTGAVRGVQMRAIYLRSLLFVFGLMAILLLESFAPPAPAAIAPNVDFGHAHDAA